VHWARGPQPATWVAIDDADGLVLQSVKRAEDGEALILRLYEAHGGRGTARVRLNRPVGSAQRATLLEEPLGDADIRDGAIAVSFRPWEIVTLRVDLEAHGS
jgi:alpha-mannosidase